MGGHKEQKIWAAKYSKYINPYNAILASFLEPMYLAIRADKIAYLKKKT